MSSSVHVIEKLKEAVALRQSKKYALALTILEGLLHVGCANETARTLYVDTLLKLGRYEAIVSCPFAREVDGRSAAIAADLLQRNGKEIQKMHLAPGPALQRAAAILMIKDEEDIIGLNLRWHYHLGIRKFCVLDNGSMDTTRDKLLDFRSQHHDAELLIIDDPGVAHYQGAKTTGMLRFCSSYWPELEWVLLIDADEFLCCVQPLHLTLAAAAEQKADAIVVPKSHYSVTEKYDFASDAAFFNKIISRGPLTHVSAKIIVRTGSYTISQGNHFIIAEKNQRIEYVGGYGLGLHYREFSIRSPEQMRKKVINGGRAVLAAEKRNFIQVGGGHWKKWYLQYQDEGEPAIEKIFRSMMKKEGSLIGDPMPLQICLKHPVPEE